MNAITVDATIDEAIARALPALRPLLGMRVELVAREAAATEPERRTLTLSEFIATRLERPAGVAPVTLDDMENAIAEGALGHAFR